MKFDPKLLEYLSSFCTERRLEVIDEVLSKRTRHFTVVTENLYQSQNISAVQRSCECFGIQDLHVIQDKNEYNLHPGITRGSDKWMDTYKYAWENENNAQKCISTLKEKGYQIVVTSPHKNDIELPEFDITKKSAFVFGEEQKGVSDLMKANADVFLKIPMNGFTESLNISVAAALVVQNTTERLIKSNVDWKLTTQELNQLKLDWVLKSVRSPESLIKKFNELEKL